MSFDAFETSRRKGSSVFLFRFLIGTKSYTYTDADKSFEYLGETYEPYPLDPSSTGQSQELTAQRITITSGREWLIPSLYVAFVPATQVYLAIFHFHRNDPQQQVYNFWSGFVRDAKWQGSKASIECDPVSVMLDRLGLRRLFHGMCNHILYDGFCPVPKSAFRVDGILSNPPTGFTLDAPEWASKPAGWFKAGFVERLLPTGVKDLRFIVGSAGTQITLLSPFPDDVQSGEVISAYAGCDHIFTTCESKFGAFTDTGGAYGGWHRVPRKNPFKINIDALNA